MPCFYPIKAYESKTKKTSSGKKYISFGNNPNAGDFPEQEPWLWNRIELPCGQCTGCRLEHAKGWAVRCILEAKQWTFNYFITLTYSPENVPINTRIDTETGEVIDIMTLKKQDLQNFMKRLRRYYEYHFGPSTIRFFACGEYGEETERPHYHAILFNLPIPDLEPYFVNHEHQMVWKSKIIDDIWGLGITSVGEVSYQSAAYVARYILKKQKGPNKVDLGRADEFTLMSRRPGIAAEYYQQYKEDIYKNDEIIITARMDKAIGVKPPRYFDKLYDLEEPDKLWEAKFNRRQKAINSRNSHLSSTTNTADELLKIKERKLVSKTATLKRTLKEL